MARSKTTVKAKATPDKSNSDKAIGSLDRAPIISGAYRTGFCSVGGHEGATVFSKAGTRLRSCSGEYVIQGKTYTCTCDCHEAFRQIAEITGLTTKSNKPMDLVGLLYSPSSMVDGDAVTLPAQREGEPAFAPVAASEPPQPTTPAAVAAPGGIMSIRLIAPPTPSARFAPTPTGQRARGQLEAEVARVVFGWFKSQPDKASPRPIRTDECASLVSPSKPPSQGAVYAIFKRWSSQGLCELADKPFRLVKLTDRGERELYRLS